MRIAILIGFLILAWACLVVVTGAKTGRERNAFFAAFWVVLVAFSVWWMYRDWTLRNVPDPGLTVNSALDGLRNFARRASVRLAVVGTLAAGGVFTYFSAIWKANRRAAGEDTGRAAEPGD
jgi:hypothetical protein